MNKKLRAFKYVVILFLLINLLFPQTAYASNINKELTLYNLTAKAISQLKEGINEELKDSVKYTEFKQMVEESKVKEVYLEFKDYIYFVDIMDEFFREFDFLCILPKRLFYKYISFFA